MVAKILILNESDIRQLRPVLYDAVNRGWNALDPDALVKPDDIGALLDSIRWGTGLMDRIDRALAEQGENASIIDR